jgi:hypothetical protein
MFFPVPPQDAPDPRRPSAVGLWVGRIRAWGREHPWRFTVLFVVLAFLGASFLPMWTAWYFGPWGANPHPATFWEAVSALVPVTRQPDPDRLVIVFYGPEAAKLVGLVAVSAAVGRVLAGSRVPDEAVDYDDATLSPPQKDGPGLPGKR